MKVLIAGVTGLVGLPVSIQLKKHSRYSFISFYHARFPVLNANPLIVKQTKVF